MKKYICTMLGYIVIALGLQGYIKTSAIDCQESIMDQNITLKQPVKLVKKHILKNGLTVLVRETHTIPKVSLQIWYNVGSKDEQTGEKGIAHLIEHMIFKGTQKLSESDINIVSHMLSGSINAFTSYDYTGYLFNLPTHNWHEALPIMADCMMNATFKEDHLSSEMKAVIQELKMYRDDYNMSLAEELISSIFADHPYHYPIIGFKQDLWNVHSSNLKSFYKKHYLPNNATLVIVGDVKAQDVFELAQKTFGDIPANPNYKKEEHYYNQDIASKTVTIFRDVQQPSEMIAFVTPGIAQKNEHILEITSWILGAGKSSRLYTKLVDELKLVTSISTSYWDLFEHSLFFIMFEPKDLKDVPQIEQIIFDEINSIIKNGIEDIELTRAIKKAQMGLYSIMENTQKQAYDIGKYYLATGDENYMYNFLNATPASIVHDVVELLKNCFRPSVAHKGFVLPLPESEKEHWLELQKESDLADSRILSAHKRESKLEGAAYAKNVVVHEPSVFNFPKYSSFTLNNGLKVLYYDNQNNIPKINLVLELKALPFFGPKDKPGLYKFVSRMLSESTKNYTGTELAREIESKGMSFYASPGSVTMSMLATDLEKGLEILYEILTNALFDPQEIEKVREQLIVDIKNFWDEPESFIGQLIRENLYKEHPYGINTLGTVESIKAITRADLMDFYKKYMSPHGAKLAIVGDLKNYDLKGVFENVLGRWQGPEVENPVYPPLAQVSTTDLNYPINRDQVVLSYAGLSIDRKNPDFDKLLLFDQIFGSGSLGSLHSRLFQLREQSGLFYTINGSLLANTDEQPGLVLIKTIVSLDRLKEAEKAILDTVKNVVDTLTPQELTQARHAVLNSLMNNFESNYSIAKSFLFLERFNFPKDFFDNRAKDLKDVTLQQVQEAVKKVLRTEAFKTFRIGRV